MIDLSAAVASALLRALSLRIEVRPLFRGIGPEDVLCPHFRGSRRGRPLSTGPVRNLYSDHCFRTQAQLRVHPNGKKMDRNLTKNLIRRTRSLRAIANRKVYGETERQRAGEFRVEFRDALADAKRASKAAEYVNAIRFLSDALELQRRRFGFHPIDFDNVRSTKERQPLSLENELEWATARILHDSDVVAGHFRARDELSRVVLASTAGEALANVAAHEVDFGASYWAAQLRIATLGALKSTAEAKQAASLMAKAMPRSAFAFAASVAAQRTEFAVSLHFLVETSLRRIEWLQNHQLKEFLTFCITCRVPSDATQQRQLLAFTDNLGPIDQVEVAEAMLVDRANQGHWRSANGALLRLAHVLAEAGSAPARKLLRTAKEGPDFLDMRRGGIDETFCGRPRVGYRAARNRLSESASDCHDIFSLAVASALLVSAERAGHDASEVKGLRGTRTETALAVSFALSLAEYIGRSGAQRSTGRSRILDLPKALAQFSSLPVVRGVRALFDAQVSADLSETVRCLAEAAVYSEAPSALDLAVVRVLGSEIESVTGVAEARARHASVDFFCALLFGSMGTEPGCLVSDARALALAFGIAMRGQFAQARPFADSARKSTTQAIAANASAAALVIYSNIGDLESACEVIAQEVIAQRMRFSSLPVSQALEPFQSENFQKLSTIENAVVALHLWVQTAHDDRLHSWRVFSIEELLYRHGVDRPSLLQIADEPVARARQLHILGRACTLEVLDMLISMGSTREVLEERAAICKRLLDAGALQEAQAYRDELLSITRSLATERGLRVIDSSRVHVDLDQLRATLVEELGEALSRFLQLAQSELSTSETFDEATRAVAMLTAAEASALGLPSSEIDGILIAILARATDRFLFGVPGGLDSNLSKRVRHGSIVGYLRAPSARESLALLKGDSGKYAAVQRPAFFESIVQTEHRELTAHLSHFSNALDDILFHLKDSVLQVRSASRPIGVFDLQITAPQYRILRSAALGSHSPDDLVSTLLVSLWAILGLSLQRAADYIQVAARREIDGVFESLRFRIAASGLSAALKAAVGQAIGRAKAGTESALAQCAEWFGQLIQPLIRSATKSF